MVDRLKKLRLIYPQMFNHVPTLTVIGFIFKYIHYYNIVIKLANGKFKDSNYDMLIDFSRRTGKCYDHNKAWLSLAVNHITGHLAVREGSTYSSNKVGLELFEFFGAIKGKNKYLTNNFCNVLEKEMPTKINTQYKDPQLRSDVIDGVSSGPSDGPYCYKLKRNYGTTINGRPYKRTPQNTQKAWMLVRDLYNKIVNGTLSKAYDISFVFSNDKSMEPCETCDKDNQQKIYDNFVANENKKLRG